MSRRLRLLAAAAALALVCSGCNFSLQSLPKLSAQTGPSYTLKATFANVLNLPAEAIVRTGVATVGHVTSITTKNFQAHVTMAIRSNVKLPVGTTAQARFDSPLGDEYITLVPPPNKVGGPYLTSGASLSENQTTSAPSIEDALGALSLVLNGGGLNQAHIITVNLNDMFNGNQSSLRDLLTQLRDASTSLAGHESDIDGALSAIGNLSQALNQGSPVLTTGLDTIPPAVNVLANENGDIDQLLVTLNNLAVTANNILNAAGGDLVNDAQTLVPVLNQLVSVDQQLGTDFGDIANFEALTPKIAPGDYLQVSLNAVTNFGTQTTAQTTPTGPARGALTLASEALP